ncbi:MAG: lysophospholipid acyltransferase family protein [Acidobacteriota bacterium]
MSARSRQALVFRLASTVLSFLPRRLTLPLAHALGQLSYFLLGRRRQVALDNLTATLGRDWGEAERRRVARRSFGHSIAMGMDLLTLPAVTRSPTRYCTVEEGSLELLRGVLAERKGALLVAGHFGLMESMGILLGHEKITLHFVSKPFDDPSLDAAVNALRGATGNGFIHKGGAKDRILETLASGEAVAVVADQHVHGKDRAWIPWFGLPAATTRSLGTMALLSGAPLVPIHSFPRPGGRAHLEFGPAIRPGAMPEDPDEARAVAERLVALATVELEKAVRRQPGDWLWLHRRFKVCPEGLEDRYPPRTEPVPWEWTGFDSK